MTRSDIHRPTAIDPENYDHVDSYDLGTGVDADVVSRRMFIKDVARLDAEGKRLADHLEAGSWRYTCGTCGQVGLRYVALVVHAETGEYMVVGGTCIGTTFQTARAELDRLQAAAAEARKKAALLAGFNELLANHPEIAEAPLLIERAFTFDETAGQYWHERHRKSWAASTLKDIMGKARQYGGEISEKQIAFAARLVAELIEAEAVTAQKDAEHAAKRAEEVNAAIGEIGERRQFTGEVVWAKNVANDFDPYGGDKTIMIIRTAEGTIKWFASKVIEVNRGSKISFTATVKKHEIYQDRITTIVQRPAKVEIS
jgi:hypothetical protein